MKAFFLPFILALLWPLASSFAYETESLNQGYLKANFCHVLDGLHNEFSAYYGPRKWKEEHLGWSLDEAITQAKNQIMELDSLDRRDYQRVLLAFFNSMEDYHVGVYFTNQDYAFLPFDVISAGGRTFISYVNWDFVSEETFHFSIGDELVEFDGQPIQEVLEELKTYIGGSHPSSNLGLADKLLTIRPARIGLDVPKGPVTIKVKSQGDEQIHGLQLAWTVEESFWSHEPQVREKMLAIKERRPRSLPTEEEKRQLHLNRLERFVNPTMKLPLSQSLHQAYAERGDVDENPFSLGAKQSVLPDLGEITWSFESYLDLEWEDHDLIQEGDDPDPFQAYIYENKEGRSIGFIRIPAYTGRDYDARCFARIVEKMEEEAEALIIDQMFNPGGSVLYCYALASMLANQPLENAKDQWCLNDCDYLSAKFNQMFLEQVQDEEDAQSTLGEAWFDYPMGFQAVQMYLHYLDKVIDSWERGAVLTEPFHLAMIDQINPNPWFRFSKPILLLINHMDFSCADHFPVLMQDNQRAVLMGTRTAGAGGCVVGSALGSSNHTGLDFFRITNSLAIRPNGQPYENLGVTPDIEYVFSVEDIQNHFTPMAAAVNEEVSRLLSPLEERHTYCPLCGEEEDEEEEWL